jgi:hypothetical protein
VPLPNSYLHFVIFDELGTAYYSSCDIVQNTTSNFFIDTFGLQVYSLLAFISEPHKKTRVCKNLIYKRGAGMRYSLEEQLTGDIWLDGRPIYQRTFMSNNHSLVSTVTTLIHFPEPDVSALIKSEINSIDNNNGTPFRANALLGQSQAEPQTISISTVTNYSRTNNAFNLSIVCRNQAQATNMNNAIIYVTFFYTKQSDQPVVDG